MKNRNWFWILIIIVTAAVFVGYRSMTALRADTEPPEIQVDTELLELSVEDPKSALLQGITAVDNKDGDVTESLVVENVTMLDSHGTVTVTFAAFDAAGNVTRSERKALYTDYVGPRFVLSRPMVYTQGSSFDVLSDVGATDDFDGDIQHRVRAAVQGEESILIAGTHVVQFRVTNSMGDTHVKSLPVEVLETDIYDADLELKQYLVYLPVGAAFNASDYLKSFSYRNNSVELSGRVPAGFELDVRGQVQTQNPGTYTVSYTMTYNETDDTNAAITREYSAYSKLIVIVEG